MYKNDYKYILLLVLLLAPFVILCFYAHPVADDFWYARKTIGWGYLQAQKHDFLEWNGRYFSNALILATPLCRGSFLGYQLVALALILLTFLSTFFLFSSFESKGLSPFEKTLASLLFTALLLNIAPSLVEDIYWLTGSVTYQLGNIVAVCYAGLMLRYIQKRFIFNRTFHLVACIVALFMAIGFNEVLMLLLILAHLILWLKYSKDESIRFFWLRMGVLSLAFALIMILAPGNSHRGSLFSNAHQLFYSLGMTLLQMVRFFFLWISSIPLLLSSILSIGFANKLYASSPIFKRIASMHLWQAFGILCLIIFLCVFPAYWATGILGQHRTVNVACFFFIPAWFLFSYIAFRQTGIAAKERILSGKAKRGILLLIALCILFYGNSGRALKEFATGEVSSFNNEMNERYTKLEIARIKGDTAVFLPLIKSRPSSLFFLDITPNSNYWINKSYAEYFGVNRVCMDTITQHDQPR